jgi:Protein of unknown function (DUF3800)
MILQGYIDDSGSEPQSKFFLLGGFVSTISRWAQFSNEWHAVLNKPPVLDYFKTTEAMSLHTQFDEKRGWTEALRDNRVQDLVQVIKNNVEMGVHVYTSNDTFHRLIGNLPLPYRNLSSDTPYSLLFAQMSLVVARLQYIFDSKDKCDLIFDQQLGFQVEAMQWWSLFKKDAAERGGNSITEYMGSPPSFKDDKKFKPLQAADLFAWHRRRRLDGMEMSALQDVVLSSLEEIPHMMVPLSDALLSNLRDYLAQSAAGFAEMNPDVPFVTASKRARRRTRRTIGTIPPSDPSSDGQPS